MSDQPRSAGRREFLGAAAAALFAGMTITILGCQDDKGTGSTGSAEAGDMQGTISDNHGHQAIIKKAQLLAGGAITLNIQGTAAHNHTVSLTADEMASLKGGGMVTKESSGPSAGSAHTHSIMFM